MATLPERTPGAIVLPDGRPTLDESANDEAIKHELAALRALLEDHEARLVGGGL